MYNYPMNQNGKAKVYIAGFLAVMLIAATCVYFIFFSTKRDSNKPEETMPSGTVTISEELPVDAPGVNAEPSAPSPDDYSSYPLDTPTDCQAVIDSYSAANNIDPFAYPLELTTMLYKNHDALEFVLHYPEMIGTQDAPDYPGTIDVTGTFSSVRVPEYYQYDLRWGYMTYAGGVLGMTGSGPTALSMVVSYLMGNSDMNPAWMAAFAENNHFTLEGGTSWSLMTEGATGLGIDVTPITADQTRIERNLDVGNIVMCLMGPGDFTDSAQYILIVGYNDEGYEIRDPGSPARTAMRWQFDRLAPQMEGCWIMRIL